MKPLRNTMVGICFLTSNVFAGTGGASDEEIAILLIVGIFALLASILHGISFLRKKVQRLKLGEPAVPEEEVHQDTPLQMSAGSA
jgi:hypothetical protein